MCSFYLIMGSFVCALTIPLCALLIICSLYVLYLRTLCICSFNVLFLCFLGIRLFYVLFWCSLCIRFLHLLFLCALFIRSFYVLHLCAIFHVLFLCTLCIRLLHALFSCAILMCFYNERLAVLRMYWKYYCIQTNMENYKMDHVLKKLCLSAHRVKIVEEKILTNIVCYLSVEDFLSQAQIWPARSWCFSTNKRLLILWWN